MIEKLSEILDTRCVTLEMQSRRKPDVLEELVAAIVAAHAVSDANALKDELLEREKLSSTGIGGGIAIPHKLTGRVQETCLAFGRKTEGLKFDAVDRRPVQLFFLLLGPEGTHTQHLKLLSKLSRYLHDSAFVEGLMNAGSAEEVQAVLEERDRTG